MRVFVALWPPAGAVAELEAALTGVRPQAPTLHWAATESWHLTLAFFGEVAETDRPELERRLARVAARYPPLALRFAGAGRLGSRVLVLRLDGDLQPLKRLAASTGAAARRIGIAAEERPYRPHLTLARARGTRDRDDLRPTVARLASFEGSSWTATAMDLVQSQLGRGPGGRAAYETLASFPLEGRAAPRDREVGTA